MDFGRYFCFFYLSHCFDFYVSSIDVLVIYCCVGRINHPFLGDLVTRQSLTRLCLLLVDPKTTQNLDLLGMVEGDGSLSISDLSVHLIRFLSSSLPLLSNARGLVVTEVLFILFPTVTTSSFLKSPVYGTPLF